MLRDDAALTSLQFRKALHAGRAQRTADPAVGDHVAAQGAGNGKCGCRGVSASASKSHEDGFWIEQDSPVVLDVALNLIFQSYHFGGGGVAGIHQCKRVLV